MLALLTATFAVAAEKDWNAPASEVAKKNPVPADAKSIAEGKRLYEMNCASCHGKTGKGDGEAAKAFTVSPGDLTNADKIGRESDGALFWKITVGHPPMPPFVKMLSEQQRWQVVNYMRTLSPKSTTANQAATTGTK